MRKGKGQCPLRRCRSGKPPTVATTENIGDGAWRVFICDECAKALGLAKGADLPEADTVRRLLVAYYRKGGKHGSR